MRTIITITILLLSLNLQAQKTEKVIYLNEVVIIQKPSENVIDSISTKTYYINSCCNCPLPPEQKTKWWHKIFLFF